jgi:hypothetical protein
MPALARPTAARTAVALLVLGAADAATAAAQAGTPPATIEACYVPVSGTIYRINTTASPAPGAPANCLSPQHVKFSWSRQGLSDFSEVTSQANPAADALGRRSMSVACPAGKTAIGGYYAIFANGGNYGWGVMPVSSGTFASSFNPADPPDTFFVLTADAPGYANTPTIRVGVKCAKTAP